MRQDNTNQLVTQHFEILKSKKQYVKEHEIGHFS